MLSQPMTNETVVIVTSNGINLSQTENPKSTNQGQDILKKLKAEIKVLGVSPIQNVLEWEGVRDKGKKLCMSWDWRSIVSERRDF